MPLLILEYQINPEPLLGEGLVSVDVSPSAARLRFRERIYRVQGPGFWIKDLGFKAYTQPHTNMEPQKKGPSNTTVLLKEGSRDRVQGLG